jgi:glycosyltransferase involved in cell wall biosynthesis
MKTDAQLRVGLFLNQPVWFDGETYTVNYMNLLPFFFRAGSHLGRFDLCLPVRRSQKERGRYALKPEGSRILHLPFYFGEREVLCRSPALLWGAWRLATRVVDNWDIVVCTSPSLIGSVFSRVAHARGKPVVHLIRGNKRRTLAGIYSRGPAHWIFDAGVRILDTNMRRSLKNGAGALAVGDDLLRLYEPDAPNRIWPFAPLLSPEFESLSARTPKPAPAGKISLLYVGRLSGEKGLTDLLEALALLGDANDSGISLKILGDGPQRDDLVRRAEMMGLGDRVSFSGFVPLGHELIGAYRDAFAFVLPSYTEGVPASLVEAMILGVPVISTAVGGIPGLLGNNECGLLVQPRAPRELADAVLRLIGDNGLRGALIGRGYQRACEYRESAQLSAFLGALRSLTSPPAADEPQAAR